MVLAHFQTVLELAPPGPGPSVEFVFLEDPPRTATPFDLATEAGTAVRLPSPWGVEPHPGGIDHLLFLLRPLLALGAPGRWSDGDRIVTRPSQPWRQPHASKPFAVLGVIRRASRIVEAPLIRRLHRSWSPVENLLAPSGIGRRRALIAMIFGLNSTAPGLPPPRRWTELDLARRVPGGGARIGLHVESSGPDSPFVDLG